jgi:predicted nucleic acid-binding protein
MSHAGVTAVLDANVLYPAPLRDYLLNLAQLNLFKPRWTDDIQEEWIYSLLAKRKDISRKSLESAKNAMNRAFPNANIVSYQSGINSIMLPDKKDRHVLAAAIKSDADTIVTFNTKDFPVSYLQTFSIRVYHPDDLILELMNDYKSECFLALNNQVSRLQNPPKSIEEVLNALRKSGLVKTVMLLKELIK